MLLLDIFRGSLAVMDLTKTSEGGKIGEPLILTSASGCGCHRTGRESM